jgi:hypothetical protein
MFARWTAQARVPKEQDRRARQLEFSLQSCEFRFLTSRNVWKTNSGNCGNCLKFSFSRKNFAASMCKSTRARFAAPSYESTIYHHDHLCCIYTDRAAVVPALCLNNHGIHSWRCHFGCALCFCCACVVLHAHVRFGSCATDNVYAANVYRVVCTEVVLFQ